MAKEIKTNVIETPNLNPVVFGIVPNQQVLYDVVNAQRAAMRQGTHSVKTRAEVAGGGKKPWRQKGTGRARQGSIRSPQWRGGGVVFGPTPRSYAVKVNAKVKKLALRSALSAQTQKNQLIVVDSLEIAEAKTKVAAALLQSLNAVGRTLLVDGGFNEKLGIAARNIPGVSVISATHVSVYDLLNCKTLVLSKAAVAYFEEVLA